MDGFAEVSSVKAAQANALTPNLFGLYCFREDPETKSRCPTPGLLLNALGLDACIVARNVLRSVIRHLLEIEHGMS